MRQALVLHHHIPCAEIGSPPSVDRPAPRLLSPVYWKKDENISSTGDYIRNWNMQKLQPGTYMFTVLYNDKKVSQKFVKQ